MALTLDLDMADHQRKQKGRATRFRMGFIGFWDEVVAYAGARTDLMFVKLKKGGSFRGETWEPFKTATVARGGTHTSTRTSAFGFGGGGRSGGSVWNVSSKSRKVRNRVPASQASLIQDTMDLRREIAQTIFTKAPRKLSFGTALKYAAAQQELRPILFWEDGRDEKEIGKIALRWMVTGKK